MSGSGFHERLPCHTRARIPVAKLRDYLLDPDHPVGGSKARFFLPLGFSRSRWRALERELRNLILREPAWAMPPTEHGQKFHVRGTILGPWRREARLVTVWIVRTGEDAPRFVTAYPWKTP